MAIPLTEQQLFANNAISLLAAPISATSTSLTIIPGAGALFPQPTGDGTDFFLVTLEDQLATVREIIKVTGRTGDTLTFSLADRAQEGTIARAWSSAENNDTIVDVRVTAETLDRLQQLPQGSGGGGGSLDLVAENAVAGTYSAPTATGQNAIAIGDGAQALGDKSLAIGEQAVSRHPGAEVFASGRFAGPGDVQAGKYLLRTVTVNGLSTELFFDGVNGSSRLTLPDDCTWSFRIMVTAHRTDGTDGHAGYRFEGVIFRSSGQNTVSFQGRPVKHVLAEGNSSWDVNIYADTSTGALSIRSIGQPGKIIRWAALVETVEITN